jgi:Protein of unknown function (DUF3572)
MKSRSKGTREAAETVAVQAFSYLAAQPERLGRFLALTGIGPAQIRAAAAEPGFLAGVLDYIASDQELMTGFAAESGHNPSTVDAARIALGGGWERDLP